MEPAAGYALVAVAGVLAVVAGLVTLSGALSHMRTASERHLEVRDRLETIGAASVEFAMIHKRLPCPAAVEGAAGRETRAADGYCRAPDGGRVPWRSLALSERVARDMAGEAIIYAVRPALAAPGGLTDISDAGVTAFSITARGGGGAQELILTAGDLRTRAGLGAAHRGRDSNASE